jgi:plastocyanin
LSLAAETGGRCVGHVAVRAGPLLCTLALVLAGCTSAESDSPPEDSVPTEGLYGTVAPAVNGLPSVVLLEGEGAARPRSAESPRIDQLGLQFTPRVLIAPLGDSIVFTNSESIAHNVVVRPSEGGEDLRSTDTPPGGSVSLVIEEPGAYDVTCDIHPGMIAMVFVTSAPYGAVAEPDGSFELTDVPPGHYTLRVWSLDERERHEQEVEVVAGRAVEVVVHAGAS